MVYITCQCLFFYNNHSKIKLDYDIFRHLL